MRQHFKRALKNIATHGDTDIFPYPLENSIFYDCEEKVLSLLLKIHKDFDDYFNIWPPFNENQLVPIGYSGFRWATQVDPLWNAYFLGMVISIGDKIEKTRIPVADQRIFSYRFITGSEDKLFNSDIGWHAFHRRSLEIAKDFEMVVICDIGDFYQRVRHHRLENALNQLENPGNIPSRINKFLSNFSHTYSHGLPVGGPAARLLSELLLNQTDQLLRSQGIQFCRFADDYHIFASSEDDAYDKLLFLSKKLLSNEGLALQKSKTRLMSSSEFQNTSPLPIALERNEDEINSTDTRRFLSISLRFDPYSLTAEQDYYTLKSEIERFDLMGMLRKEVAKSRIDSVVTKQIIRSLKYISSPIRDQAVLSVCDALNNLYPIFPSVMLVFKQIWRELSDQTKLEVNDCIYRLFKEKSYLIKTEINQLYACRLLSCEQRQESIELFQRLFSTSESSMIKRDIILTMFNWRYVAWLSDLRSQYSGFSPPLRRAFIIGSYGLGEEGRHWRTHNSKNFSDFEKIVQDWASSNKEQKSDISWQVPL